MSSREPELGTMLSPTRAPSRQGATLRAAAARRAAWAVAGDLVLLDADPGEIEHHEVGHHAFAHEATVAQAHDARGLEGEAADGVLEGQELPLTHPLAQHVARLTGGAEVRVEMRAGVGLRRDGVAGLHILRQLDVYRR